ncbi:MAG: hypothetical protein KF746_27520 [Chitinophagaceae bacterium]|nr:hypothetical protein [Chitinophagaceae bacterium]
MNEITFHYDEAFSPSIEHNSPYKVEVKSREAHIYRNDILQASFSSDLTRNFPGASLQEYFQKIIVAIF